MQKHLFVFALLLLSLTALAQGVTSTTSDHVTARQRLRIGTDTSKYFTSIVTAFPVTQTHRQLPSALAVRNFIAAWPLTGDLTGTLSAPVVDGLQGRPVAATAPSSGQVLKWNGSSWEPAADAGTTYTGGTGINITGTVITNTAPDQTVSLTNGGGVTVSGTYPAFTLTAADNSPTNEIELPSQTGNAGRYLTTNGTTPSWGTISGTGTVTSVGLSLPAQFSVSGSPVTTSGTLTAAWANQSPNLVFAGPASGGAVVPGFRGLVNADLPSNIPTFGSSGTGRIPYYTATSGQLTTNALFYRDPNLPHYVIGEPNYGLRIGTTTTINNLYNEQLTIKTTYTGDQLYIAPVVIDPPQPTGAGQGAALDNRGICLNTWGWSGGLVSGRAVIYADRTGDGPQDYAMEFGLSDPAGNRPAFRFQGDGRNGYNTSTPLASTTHTFRGATNTASDFNSRFVNSSMNNVGVNVMNDGKLAVNLTTPSAQLQTQGTGSTSATYSLIATNSSGSTATAPLAVRDDGQVGIGTNAPARVLHVVGNMRLTGSAGTPTLLLGRDANGDISNIATGASNGQVLQWNGTTWVPATLSLTDTHFGNTNLTISANRTHTFTNNAVTFDASGATIATSTPLIIRGKADGTNSTQFLTIQNAGGSPLFSGTTTNTATTLEVAGGSKLRAGAGALYTALTDEGSIELHQRSTDASSAQAGEIWWNNTSERLRIRNSAQAESITTYETDIKGSEAFITASTSVLQGANRFVQADANTNSITLTAGAALIEGQLYTIRCRRNSVNPITISADTANGFSLGIDGDSALTPSSYTCTNYEIIYLRRFGSVILVDK